MAATAVHSFDRDGPIMLEKGGMNHQGLDSVESAIGSCCCFIDILVFSGSFVFGSCFICVFIILFFRYVLQVMVA